MNREETQKTGLLTDRQAAQYLQMSESWLRQVRMEGNRRGRKVGPPFVRIGRAIRYRLEDLDIWIEEHLQGPVEAA